MAYVRARYAQLNFNFIIYDKKSVNGTMGDIAIERNSKNWTKIYIKSLFIPFESFWFFRLCFWDLFFLNFRISMISIELDCITEPKLRPNTHEHWTDFVRLCFTVNVIVSLNFNFVRIWCFSLEWFVFENIWLEFVRNSINYLCR